jgi:mRNA-degrading endonuclease toxin of MazEF toxin-antitoxin module
VRQGEIRDLDHGGARMVVVLLSGDTWNASLPPLVAPIRRGLSRGLFPAVIALHDTDPYGGGVDLSGLGTVDAAAVGPRVHGVLGGQTTHRLREAIAAIVEG